MDDDIKHYTRVQIFTRERYEDREDNPERFSKRRRISRRINGSSFQGSRADTNSQVSARVASVEIGANWSFRQRLLIRATTKEFFFQSKINFPRSWAGSSIVQVIRQISLLELMKGYGLNALLSSGMYATYIPCDAPANLPP